MKKRIGSSTISSKFSGLAVLAAASILIGSFLAAQPPPETSDSYTLPPESVVELFDRDKNFARLDDPSPDGKYFLVPLRKELSTLEKMAEETYRLAMLELRPRVNREWRLDTYGFYGLRIYDLDKGEFRSVELPGEALVSDMIWSPDGRQIAFVAHLKQASQVWTADAATGEARALSAAPVMQTLTAPRRRGGAPSQMLQWTPQGEVIALLVPEDRGPEPARPPTPAGPIVKRTRKKPTPTRTLPFLLQTETDRRLFKYYTTAQIAVLAAGKTPRKIGAPGMFTELSLSPDGRHLLAERIVEPFSDLVGYSDFPHTLEVLDMEGNVVSTVREIPLQEAIRRGGSRGPEADLPRDVSWRPDGKGLSFLWKEPKKKEDDGDGEETEESGNGKRMDRLMLLEPPFNLDDAEVLVQSEKSFSGISYAPDGSYVFAEASGKRESDGKNVESVLAWDLRQDPPREIVLAEEYDPEDILKLPGEVLTQAGVNGLRETVIASDGHAYLKGEGYREDFKPRPFIDRVNLADGSRQRVFEGSSDIYEEPLTVLDEDLSRMIVSRESPMDFPDSFLWTADAAPRNLTQNRDPFPETTACKRVDFEFERRDGTVIQGRISLPVGYQEGTRVPAMIWTYPREYKSVEEYGKAAIRSRNRNEFSHLEYLRWSDIWLTQGYAVVAPDVPIIGKGNLYNDKYISHLTDTLYAAIRKVDEMGYVDPDRVGHGGHSYGAFATANLLAHSPYFKAGIAGDGAYNRTLTPMTFQRERRFVWEAQHTYLEMSPFFYADQIETPLLMYHGAHDNNSGTYPIQSERMIQALTGLGKTAVLYVYPYESHSPRARENMLDLWARWLQWFDKYVKGRGAEEEVSEGSD